MPRLIPAGNKLSLDPRLRGTFLENRVIHSSGLSGRKLIKELDGFRKQLYAIYYDCPTNFKLICERIVEQFPTITFPSVAQVAVYLTGIFDNHKLNAQFSLENYREGREQFLRLAAGKYEQTIVRRNRKTLDKILASAIRDCQVNVSDAKPEVATTFAIGQLILCRIKQFTVYGTLPMPGLSTFFFDKENYDV